MAEAIVSIVIGKLADLLIQQKIFLVGGQVEDIRNELLWIQSFLKDAESRQDESILVRNWLSEISDVAYKIEDIVDTYILKVADEDVLDHPRRRRRFLGFLTICQKMAKVYSIGKEIKDIKSQMRHIGQTFGSGGRYRMKPFSQEIFQQLRRSSPYDDAIYKDIFGLDKKVDELVAELLNEEDGCHCISITGMGGIGKTTLATKIYNCEEVKHHFECRAWANVSEEFYAKDIFERLIREVKPSLSTEELREMEVIDFICLQNKLRGILEGRTYLVVLDDIWSVEAWEMLKKVFPQHSKKGRVILTSRIVTVARESVIHQLPTLNEMDSWKLFVVKAFGIDDCPTNLEELGREMVKKCDGLPVAITALANLVREKMHHGQFMVGDCFQQLMEGQLRNHLGNILSLSYNHLPYPLKPCYLYIGLFPEDYVINVEELIRLWLAEGFIMYGRYGSMEDEAREYLHEFINRSMLTVAEHDDFGKALSCRIHVLLRDFCISKGKEENFLDYYPGASSSSSSTTGIVCKSRRYAIHSSGVERFDFSNLSNSHVRTLLLFKLNIEDSLRQQLLLSILNIRLLRVLDLSFVKSQGLRLPNAFGNLIYLRYLRLSFAWSDIAEGALSKLIQLRYLLLSNEYWGGLHREVGLPRIDTLTNLQTLWRVNALVWKQSNTTNLINLQDLWIINIEASDVESVLSSIGKLDKIKILRLELSMEGSPEYAFPALVHLSLCHHLQDLTLEGKIERLPEFRRTSGLTKLRLEYSKLRPKAMVILEKLPCLILLYLSIDSIMGKKIVCSSQGFPRLQVFNISGLETEEWEIKEGALPMLNRLAISDCPKLKKIPMGLRFVATLQVLELRYLPQEFRDRFHKGEDAHEIGHISSIKTSWMRREGDSVMEDVEVMSENSLE